MKRCTEWRGEHAAVVDNHVNYIDRLARYEDEDEDGRLIHLPVPLGAPVYYVHDRCYSSYQFCPFNGGYGTDRCRLDDESFCKSFYELIHFSLRNLSGWGKDVFRFEYEAQDEVNRRNRND